MLNSLNFSHLSSLWGLKVYFKMEHEQRTGSVKVPGVHNKVKQLSGNIGQYTVVTASTGNNGLACHDAMQKYQLKVIFLEKNNML